MEMPRIESPCIKVCVIDKTTRLCEGCGRTLDEIALWATYTNEDRRRIMAELPKRLGRPTKRDHMLVWLIVMLAALRRAVLSAVGS